ncbi:MAG TPA: hypothetical protein VF538_12170 [Pyrinomonadaceae bacterium]|jgi:hypothetical protein
MYFRTQGGNVYHVLHDTKTGVAPCGARLNRSDLARLKEGTTPREGVQEKPEDAPVCDHCEKLTPRSGA